MSTTRDPPIHVVVDTNVLLQYKRLDQIDWSTLSLNPVKLIILPVVLRELEELKIGNNARVRERAAKTVTWFGQLAKKALDVKLKPGVRVCFHTQEPLLDFAEHKLAVRLKDDEVLAGIIALTRDEAVPVGLLTADIGLRLKALQRGFEVHEPPDTDKLPDEQDVRDKEIADLRKENLQFKNRAPKLSVVFKAENEPRQTLVRAVPSQRHETLEVMQMRHLPLGAEPPATPDPYGLSFLRQMQLPVSAEARQRYNDDLAKFFKKYPAFLEEHARWKEMARCRFQLDLSLLNTGTNPASNIDVVLQFPGYVALLTKKMVPPEPEAPDVPKVPEPLDYINSLKRSGIFGHEGQLRDYVGAARIPEGRDVQDWSLKVVGNEVHFRLGRLKQTMAHEIAPFWLQFASPTDMASFSVEVTMTADELMAEGKQTVALIVPETK
jgi:hypothetical protein